MGIKKEKSRQNKDKKRCKENKEKNKKKRRRAKQKRQIKRRKLENAKYMKRTFHILRMSLIKNDRVYLRLLKNRLLCRQNNQTCVDQNVLNSNHWIGGEMRES